ncbi:MAG: hypothetical protein ABIJ00_04245 [Candidatus Eisenbacteria bacterium]
MSDKQYAITLDKERCIVRLIVHGEIAKDVGERIITQARTTAAENQYNILCDVRQARVKASFADWFYLPRKLAVFQKTRAVKTAILITSGQQEEEYKFFETVTHNLGIGHKIFLQEDDALDWLKEVMVEKG